MHYFPNAHNSIFIQEEFLRYFKKAELQKENFHLLLHSPNVYSSSGWVNVKLGASAGHPPGSKDLNTWATFCCFPRDIIKELDYIGNWTRVRVFGT